MLLRTGWWFAFGRTCPSVEFINLNWIAPIDGAMKYSDSDVLKCFMFTVWFKELNQF